MSSMTSRTISTLQSRGLSRLLGTLEPEIFLRDYMCERMLHVAGPPDRWSDLFAWRDVEEALNSGLVTHPRARLVQQGREVAASEYTFERAGARWPDAQRCQQLMAQGATLILMGVDALSPPLLRFVRDLERDLGAPFRVDAVVSTAALPGLNMHWDNAECFNIQLDGQKDWKVVRPERLYPLTATHRFPERADSIKSKAPESQPDWEGTVAPGDLIYLPRGWWHAVTPRVSPSLHLSIAAEIPTLTDYLRWLALDASSVESTRRALPTWTSRNERLTSLDEALAVLRSLITPESVESYISQFSDFSPARQGFVLPSAALPGGMPLEGRSVLRLQGFGSLDVVERGDNVDVQWRGQTLTFSTAVLPALRLLDARRELTLDDLRSATDGITAHVLVFSFTTVGLLTVERAQTTL